MKVTVNKEQKLFVLDHGHGVTCLGFDVVLNRTRKLQDWIYKSMGVMPSKLHRRGSMASYRMYKAVSKDAQELCTKNHVQCPIELEPQLIGLEGHRVEVIDAYDERRRFIVGKSTGWMPCHLEISRIDSMGGPCVMGSPFKSVTDLGKRR